MTPLDMRSVETKLTHMYLYAEGSDQWKFVFAPLFNRMFFLTEAGYTIYDEVKYDE